MNLTRLLRESRNVIRKVALEGMIFEARHGIAAMAGV